VSAKDLMLYLIGKLGADGCGYKSAEFYGDAMPDMSISERMTIANLAMEMGSKCVFVPPDARTAQYLEGRLKDFSQYQPVYADVDANYEQEITVALSDLEPMIACPHQVENTKPIGEVVGTRIDQAFLGSCANGKYEDLVVAASILSGRRVDPRVRLLVTPGSKEIMLEAMKSGVLQTLIESGALVTNPGCSACAGDGGMMADGEVSLSTANRNFVGRMGSAKSSIYLSSPATLAASAIKGAIADPREFF
jgi:homoaconitase/3-isopropylmalate dehydratase large subunit